MPAPWQPAAGNGQPDGSQRPVSAAPPVDETTRYLCAAAHLDEEFCDKAIAEYLVEPVRAIPPSPGVDSAAVLRDAVAAQTRRRIRDGLLLALLAILTLTSPITVIFWVSAVTIAVALQIYVANRSRRMVANVAQLLSASAVGDPRTVAGVTRLLAVDVGRNPRQLVALVVGIWISLSIVLSLARSASGLATLEEFDASQLLPFSTWPALVIVLLMLTVLIVDEFIVAKLMASSFRRDRFNPDAGRAPSEWERRVRSLGRSSFRTELHRVARSDEMSQLAGQADVTVYRGYNPFIGAGERVHHHVIALPLEPSEGGSAANPVALNVNDLHRHVAEGFAALRSPSSLGPGRRLEELQLREQVLIPADRLLFNPSVQIHPPVLPDLSRPPLAHLPLDTARALAEDPLEWARYYSCFRVESWDRDLTTSCYLHIGTDQRMLYLEWTYCILFPVRERYRSVDRPADSPWTTFGRSLTELILLPTSVVARVRSAFRRRKMLIQRAGEVVPARYGAAQSIRELAADTAAQTYFQDADTERYVNIMDRALFRAVGKFLEKRGYSVVEFTRMASQVNNFYAPVINSPIGRGNIVAGNPVTMNPTGTSATKGAK